MLNIIIYIFKTILQKYPLNVAGFFNGLFIYLSKYKT